MENFQEETISGVVPCLLWVHQHLRPESKSECGNRSNDDRTYQDREARKRHHHIQNGSLWIIIIIPTLPDKANGLINEIHRQNDRQKWYREYMERSIVSLDGSYRLREKMTDEVGC